MKWKPRKTKYSVHEKVNRFATSKYLKILEKRKERDPRSTDPVVRRRKRISHFLKRLKERYGFRKVRKKDYFWILYNIENNTDKVRRAFPLEAPSVVYAVDFRSEIIFVIYDWETNDLCSVLPFDDNRVLKWAEKVLA